jgi:hypothetical protein
MAPEDNAPAAGQDDENTDQTESRTASTEPETDAEDTDWKALARKWEREAKKGNSALTKAQQEMERLREANQTEAEKALEAARREGQQSAEKEWKSKWQTERLRGEALRAMNGRVSDPRLAFPHLDLDGLMDDEGTVDTKALSKAIDALLDEYPALAASDSGSSHHLDLGPKRTTKAAPQDMNALLRQAAGRQ